jgi:CubicO group peptidase (beta-lactamase class C family)
VGLTAATLPSGVFQMNRDGRVVANGAFGLANPATNEACTPDTRFQAASISKQFVAAAVMLLQERGALGLDDPVREWWSPAPKEWAAMRVRHLLDHTSGLPHWEGIGGLNPCNPPPLPDLLDRATRIPLESQPGQRWRYSGPGYLVAAQVVESAGDCEYGSFVTENLFRPLGMTCTTSGLFPGSGYAKGTADGEPVVLSAALIELPGTGDLWTTAGDLLRYADAVSTGGVVAEGSWELMSSPQAAVDEPTGDRFTTRTAYGFGTFIGTLDGKSARFHTGDNPGYVSILVWLPEARITLAVLANDDTVLVGEVAAEAVRSEQL